MSDEEGCPCCGDRDHIVDVSISHRAFPEKRLFCESCEMEWDE
jgi:hypothetical protein